MEKITQTISKIKNNEKVLIKFLLGVAMVIYFVFAFHHLTKFISADEHFWLPNSGAERIQNYWKAIAERDWKDTRINDKPGITLAYTSGLALLFEKNPKDQFIYSKGPVDIYNPEKTEEINFWYRLPIVLVTALSFLFFFWIIKRITKNAWLALFATVGMLSSPILLGISQIVNPDSLFWIFGAASVLSFYLYLQKGSWKIATMTGIFLGLSLASKYVSVIFFPFFFFMFVAYFFMEYELLSADKEMFAKYVWKRALGYVFILLGGMLLFALMMPASFVEPKYFYEGTIGFPGMKLIFWLTMIANATIGLDAFFVKSRGLRFVFEKLSMLRTYVPKAIYVVLAGTFVFVLVNWLSRHAFIDLSMIPFDAKRKDSFGELAFYKKYIMQFVALAFSLTPITLFLLIFLWVKAIFAEIKYATLTLVLSMFFLVFYAGVIEQGLLVTVRYSIILFPFTMILAAIGINELLSFSKTREEKRAMLAYFVIMMPVVLLQLFSLIDQYFFEGNLRESVSHEYFLIMTVIFFVGGFLLIRLIAKKYSSWKMLENISKLKFFGAFFACNILGILLISPFYFSYTNELLPKKYIISGAWGYGGYEAAEFLNKLPNAKELTLWADVYGVCEFFVGNCIHTSKIDPVKYPVDYYFRSLQSTINPRFKTNMGKDIWRMRIDGRPKSFLKIYKEESSTK